MRRAAPHRRFMNRLKEIKMLKEQAETFALENREIITRYNMRELCSIYNGIGPESFPKWLRLGISALHPSLAVVAFIHDLEWHESDFSRESFTESNNRFTRNGYKTAKAMFAWYDPRRYLAMYHARRFGKICQAFGWTAWCEAGEAREKKHLAKK